MKTTRILMLLLGLALVHSLWNQTMRAQDNYRAKATKVTVTEPMQVPGMVLPPGEYIFRLDDSDANRHIVHIWNKDETKLITTILAIPNARLKPTDKGIMTYEERPIGQPVALEAWFYPGEGLGQQFVYPKTKSEELSHLNRVEVPSTGSEQAYSGGSAAETPAAEPTYSASLQSDLTPQAPATLAPATPQYVATTTAPARPEPAVAANTNASPETPAQLPNTASSVPLVALLGSLLIGVTLLLRVIARV